MNSKRFMSTKQMVLGAVMTALVIVFQLLATFTAFFGPFSTAIALVPIAIGACLCGPIVGAWLGLVFALVVLFTGGASLFYPFSEIGTIVTVVLKGMACGFASGIVYKALSKVNDVLAAVIAAIICPVVNTGVFLLGSMTFFYNSAQKIGELVGISGAGFAVFWGLAMANFLFELGMCAVLSPVIVKIINIAKKQFK